MKNIYITLIFLVTCLTSQILCTKNKKKSLKTTTETSETTTFQPAIIAIEIVDPSENSTKSKNSKRTIETALGYGYNSYDTSKPRYEIYKYSQHDIPPYKGDPNNIYKTSQTSHFNVQKAVQYTLPTVTERVPPPSNLLTPGMTLYSSLSAKGQVGSLTPSLSHISGLEHNQAPVPVVVLRIYPDQLKDSTIQANLPDSHPFAKSINSINIQSLLLHYIKALKGPSSVNQYSGSRTVYSTSQPHLTATRAPSTHTYASTDYYSQNRYQRPTAYQSGNTQAQQYQYYQEGFPQDSGYQQNQYQQQQQQQYSGYDSGVQVQEAPIKYEFGYQSSASKKQLPKKPAAVQSQYYYVQPTTQGDYSTESTQYYQPTQQLSYAKESEQQGGQQYYSVNDQQYPQYYQGGDENRYVTKTQKLLTTENYPTNKHTRVVFRTKTGDVRTPESEEKPTQVKTIKIQVPDNIAKVEVQESEKPYYSYQEQYSNTQQNVDQADESYDQNQGEYSKTNNYVAQDTAQQSYYVNEDTPAYGNYNYQNIDYEQMAKYFARRGAMPSYFFQQPADEEGDDQKTMSSDDIIAAYEEAAFPSTTAAPEKKKVKSKKRT